MLIIRRDLETILELMNRFDMKEQWCSVDFDYKDNAGGYELSVDFPVYLNDVVGRMKVKITEDTLGDNNEYDQ